ncbi:putative protein [Arabidopsis thaliana]|uniref:Uncharacterized protein F13I12.280 n=1 Tax=Arabidopsis thaliana TaxID=3702 RepID=Q9SD50_ARATH|nr:putative protein [Arabidopsis thaliana]
MDSSISRALNRSPCSRRDGIDRLADPIRPTIGLADPIRPTIGLADPIRRSVYQIRFVSKTNGLPSPSSTLHRTVGPGGSMRISSVELYSPSRTPFPTNNFRMGRMDASQSITSLLGTLPKGHIRSLHSFERSHPFLVSFGDATVRWYPLDLTPFGRDISSPVSYHSQPTRVSDDRTNQLGQYLISSPSSVELLRTNRLETSIELGLDRIEDKDIPIIDMEHLDMEKLREAYKDWGISHLTGIPLINVDVLSRIENGEFLVLNQSPFRIVDLPYVDWW